MLLSRQHDGNLQLVKDPDECKDSDEEIQFKQMQEIYTWKTKMSLIEGIGNNRHEQLTRNGINTKKIITITPYCI